MLKFNIILIAACFIQHTVKAQISPIYNVPGPEVANLGLYGTVPVSHFTGVPDISVPLYTVNTGKHSVPITANYHISAVKPTSAPSCLGLGWSISTGGYITRAVNGIYDEKQGSDGIGHGFYDHYAKTKNLTTSGFDNHTQYIDGDVGETPYYELSADEFTFNFCGYTGTFYLNENGGWTVVSNDDIEVIFNPQTDFVTLKQLSARITNITGWERSSYNNRFFCHFTLKTPDGCKYEFGGANGSSIDAMEFCIPYYSRNNSDLIASSWHLSKITTPDNQTITFEYDTSALMCDLKYVPQYYLITNIETPKEVPCQIGRKGYTGFLLFPVNIKSIETIKEKISFYYYPDQAYGLRFNSGCLFWTDLNSVRFDIYKGETANPYNQFNVFMKYSGSESEIARNMYSPILHRIAISNKCGGKSRCIYFDYVYNNIRKLSLITHREGIPDIIKKTEIYPDNITLTRHEIPQNLSATDIPEYRFEYDTTEKMPNTYVYADTDSWGYYNGQYIKLSDIPAFEKKYPFTSYTKAETLKSIIYPTGGSTSFEYEQNSFSKQVSDDRTNIIEKTGTSGGLRISSMTNYDCDGKFISSKKYHYSESLSINGKSSGISKGEPCSRLTYTIKQKISNNEYPQIYMASEGGYFPSVTNSSTPDVGYSCVIEEILDADANSLGYIKYRYSNFDTDIFSCRHMDMPFYHAYNISGTNATTPYSDFSFERGKLLSKEYYDNNDKCVRKETIRYRATQHPAFTTAKQEVMYLGTAYIPYSVKFGWLTKTNTCSYLPVNKEVVEYSSQGSIKYTESLRHSYNSYRLPSCDSLLMSNGKWQVTEYKYPFNFSQYDYMTSMHIINPVIIKTISANGLKNVETNVYEMAGNIPYISKRTVGKSGATRTEYEVSKTDSYGNPVEITENGISSVLVWGGYGQKLIARYTNATFKQIQYALGIDIESYSYKSIANIDYTQLENIRSRLPYALSYIYKYNGNMQLASYTDTNGFTTYYNYDMFDRLRETFFYNEKEKLMQKNIINRYDYHYHNQLSDNK